MDSYRTRRKLRLNVSRVSNCRLDSFVATPIFRRIPIHSSDDSRRVTVHPYLAGTTGKSGRWFLRLLEYDLKTVHKSGTKQKSAKTPSGLLAAVVAITTLEGEIPVIGIT